MYAVVLIRYRRPFEEVEPVLEAHRAYLRGLKDDGLLLASGPMQPRIGGVLLLRVPDDAVQQTLDRIRDNDPYIKAGVAQYEMWPWQPVTGGDALDRL
ncbi:MAG TPA: YciI family protein [Gemmatimonadales bacterium]|nr:YciI family protein [Gemmatimonadales bacterium]